MIKLKKVHIDSRYMIKRHRTESKQRRDDLCKDYLATYTEWEIFDAPPIRHACISRDYYAHTACIQHRTFEIRLAKTTPTTSGNFCSFYPKNQDNHAAPYHASQELAGLIVWVVGAHHTSSQFIFSKADLVAQRILDSDMQKGKRAFRLWTPQDPTRTITAEKNKQQQIKHYVEGKDEQTTWQRIHRCIGTTYDHS